jgi:hypothetical protein
VSDIGKGVRNYLVSKSAVTDLVSTRIYPAVLPQAATLPAVVYSVITNVPNDDVLGSSGSVTASVQLDIYSDSHITTNNISEQIRLQMQGYSGAMGDETVGASRLLNRFEQYEKPVDGSDLGRHRVIMTFDITYTNTIPTY